VIAHRGFSGQAPENTLIAIERAVSIGAEMVEVDVTMTSDGHVICLHDDTLDRTTDGSGLPGRLSLAEIKKLDAGSWFSAVYSGERIPTLAETLEAVRGRVLINVEIKAEAVASGVVPAVARLITEHEMLDAVVVSSFSPEALRLMKITEPAIATVTLFNKDLHTGRDELEIIQEVGSRGCNISSRLVTPEMIDRYHSHGIPVGVYTINEASEMRRMMELGVDAVFSDYPDRMLELVGEAQAIAAAGSGSEPAFANQAGRSSRLSSPPSSHQPSKSSLILATSTCGVNGFCRKEQE
jgi:glycerophosphoryl diester phosphodiesterase